MIDTATERAIIHKRAEGKGLDKIKAELSLKSYNPIRRVIREKKDIIEVKGRELQNKQDSLNRDILFYAKNKLLALLKSDKKQSGNELANITKALDTIARLDDNKPTSITDSKKLANATNAELLNEYQQRLDRIRGNS